MAHDHTYDCRLCGAHLDSQDDLNKHNLECHTARANSGKQSSQSSSKPSSSDPSSPPNDTSRNF